MWDHYWELHQKPYSTDTILVPSACDQVDAEVSPASIGTIVIDLCSSEGSKLRARDVCRLNCPSAYLYSRRFSLSLSQGLTRPPAHPHCANAHPPSERSMRLTSRHPHRAHFELPSPPSPHLRECPLQSRCKGPHGPSHGAVRIVGFPPSTIAHSAADLRSEPSPTTPCRSALDQRPFRAPSASSPSPLASPHPPRQSQSLAPPRRRIITSRCFLSEASSSARGAFLHPLQQ